MEVVLVVIMFLFIHGGGFGCQQLIFDQNSLAERGVVMRQEQEVRM